MSSKSLVVLTVLLAASLTTVAVGRSYLAPKPAVAVVDSSSVVPPATAEPGIAPAALVSNPVATPAPTVIASSPAVPAPVVRRTTARRTQAQTTTTRRHRSWKKTAVVIGGSTAAGAGVGALIGGKKGALIGAAVGAGSGTVYEVHKRRKHRR